MNTKIIAILMASIVAMAMAVPMAIGDNDPVAGTGAEVNNLAPYVCEKWETPNPVMPDQYPNTTSVTIKACVCDPNGAGDIDNVTATVYDPDSVLYDTVTLNRNASGDSDCTADCPYAASLPCVLYEGTLVMGACDPAGNYAVKVKAFDGYLYSTEVENTLVYQSFKAMVAGDVDFGSLNPGDTTTNTSTVTVYGNANLSFTDVSTNGYDDPDPNDGIVWSDLSGPQAIPDDQITTTWNPATCIAGCDPSTGPNSANVPFTLVVPVPQAAGGYTGTITFTPSVC